MPGISPLDPNVEARVPHEDELIARIANATRRVILRLGGTAAGNRRDVHPKHHGCVAAELVVRPDLAADLRHGVFAAEGAGTRSYRALVRFSNSSKRPQHDDVADGRGVAIKLWRVEGPHLGGADEVAQDLLMLNAPAFFARDVSDMAEVSELEADDAFPGSFFARLDRVAGLSAYLAMAVKRVRSPLELTYHSQTPYRLGSALVVKLRLRPLETRGAYDPELARAGAGNHLFHALQKDLGAPFSFELAVQRQNPLSDPVEDATVEWKGPFEPVATLTLVAQQVDARHLELAKRIAFDPWNGLVAHRPLGSLNRARFSAYLASRTQRRAALSMSEQQLNEQFEALRSAPSPEATEAPPLVVPFTRPSPLVRSLVALRGLFPRTLQWLGERVPMLAYFSSGGLLAVGLFMAHARPAALLRPIELQLASLPSEQCIPAAIPSERARGRRDLDQDPRHLFRYGPVGTELEGGVPYWIFAVLPKLYPEQFAPEGDWSHFGFRDDSSDPDYYTSYHELPRGFVLSPTTVHLAGQRIDFPLQRVSFNCASCHRGRVEVDGQSRLIDGMPNLQVDTSRYKRVLFGAMRRDDFTAPRVMAAIDDALRSRGCQPLSGQERLVYDMIIGLARRVAFHKPLQWLRERPENGPGRLDAFGALRFEFMGYDPRADRTLATVDLPSIWNQRESVRPFHHYDGNTRDLSARNFGAIVGVGGRELSIHRGTVERVGAWIDDELRPVRYWQIARGEPGDLAQGRRLYGERCAGCHGGFDERGEPLQVELARGADAPRVHPEIGTDEARLRAVDEPFVRALNAFGAQHGLWHAGAFGASRGYVAPPLDGLWLRAPYVHNGSVPSLDDLLQRERPVEFCRGDVRYDPVRGGFQSALAAEGRCAQGEFLFDTRLPGNHNGGHPIYVEDPAERRALIDYLLTL